MKLLVLGGTGATGRLIVDFALDDGDDVTVLARRPQALAGLAERVTVVAGDATSAEDVTKAIAEQNAVIAALGTGKSVFAKDLFTRAATTLVDAANRTGVSRLVWMSSFGVGDRSDRRRSRRRPVTVPSSLASTPTRRPRSRPSAPVTWTGRSSTRPR